MSVTKLQTPSDLLNEIVNEDVGDFNGAALDLRSAYHACISLLSLRDWVFKAHQGKTWSANGNQKPALQTISDFQRELNALEPAFPIITDVANSNKHMILDPNRSQTNLYGSANTEVQTCGGPIASGPIAGAPISGGSSRIVVKIDNTFHDVLQCVAAVHNMWRGLFQENNW